MALWIETSIKFDRLMENGTMKKVTEKYLVDSITFSEAEARTIERLTPYFSGEFSVSATKKTKISEIFYDASDYADKWYLVKINWITLDEKSGKEKKSPCLFLVQAGDFKNALGRFKDGMEDVMADYQIASISETKYMDVFPYENLEKSE